MADKRASLIITLKDEVSAGLSKLKGSMVALGAAATALGAFLVTAFKDYAENERAVNKLNVALKNQGVYTNAISADLQRFATELQKTTAFEDSAIMETQALLTSFGLAGSKLKDTTKAALDLSTGLGVDLTTATLLLGKAVAGETSTLSRYGIKIDESIPAAQKFDAVLQQLNTRFGGAAQAELDTASGKIANMAHRWGEVKEEIGARLLPVFDYFISKLETIISGIESFNGVVNTLKIVAIEFFREILVSVLGAIENVPLLGQAFQKMGVDVQEVNRYFDDQIAKLTRIAQQDTATTNAMVNNKKMATKTMLDIEKQFRAEEDKERVKADEKKRKFEIEVDDRIRKGQEEAYRRQAQFEEQKARNVKDTLSYISSLSTSHNKALSIIGKAAALAMAKINTAEAVTKALASAPPPFNFALAAAVGAAGAAQIATILGVQLAEGGIVLPRPGGTLATIGEGGKAEAVIPLDDDRAQGLIGGGVTININAGTIVADRMSVREFAREIDRELFSLRRNNETIGLEPL